jgi:hypothetical protein
MYVILLYVLCLSVDASLSNLHGCVCLRQLTDWVCPRRAKEQEQSAI